VRPRGLIGQGLIVLAGVMLAYLHGGFIAAGAAMFGGLVAVANAGLLMWRMRSAGLSEHASAQRVLWRVYRTGLERFALVGMLLALGMVLFEQDRSAVVAGLVLGQLAWLVVAPANGFKGPASFKD